MFIEKNIVMVLQLWTNLRVTTSFLKFIFVTKIQITHLSD